MLANVTTGVDQWWAPLLAFAAGVVSFASPCVLPLVPGYLSFITGDQAGPQGERRRLVVPIILFIVGFTVIFTVVGAFTASALGRWLNSSAGHRLAGVVVFVFGLFMILYALRFGAAWLYREERPFLSRVKPGPAAAMPLGMAFAIGWTPCIGPVLGAIFTLAAAGTTARAVALLIFYSLGLGLPFFLLGLGFGGLMRVFRFFSRNYRYFAGASGAILLAIGVLLMTGAWTRLVNPLFQFANRIHLPL